MCDLEDISTTMNMFAYDCEMSQSEDTSIQSGGAGAIEPTNERDRGAMRTAMKWWPKRWAGIDAAKKKKWTDQLEVAGDTAEVLMNQASDSETKLDAAKVLVSVVKTAAMMEGQNQHDDHKEADLANPRAAGGTQVNILNQMPGGVEDPRAVLSEMLRDPAKAKELARVADRLIEQHE